MNEPEQRLVPDHLRLDVVDAHQDRTGVAGRRVDVPVARAHDLEPGGRRRTKPARDDGGVAAQRDLRELEREPTRGSQASVELGRDVRTGRGREDIEVGGLTREDGEVDRSQPSRRAIHDRGVFWGKQARQGTRGVGPEVATTYVETDVGLRNRNTVGGDGARQLSGRGGQVEVGRRGRCCDRGEGADLPELGGVCRDSC